MSEFNTQISRADNKENPDAFRDWYLDGSQLILSEGPSGVLRLTISGDRSYLRVKVTCAFPTFYFGSHIGFFRDDDKEIGVLKSIDELKSASRPLLECALRKRYFAPKILKVISASERYGVSTWKVETDRGFREFFVVDHSQNVRHIGGGRVSIQDVDGNRFDIPDYYKLDRKSFDFLDKLI